ncbi:catalase family protein [Rhodanobacter sp. BL-MT-08]
MNANVPAAPLPYRASFEKPEDGEAKTIHGLIETLEKISHKTFEDTRHGLRGVHAKSHGLLIGQVRVLDHLPPVLAQGLFAKAGTYPAILRFSTVPGDVLDDKVSTPRALAIKLIEVEGDRLPGSEGDTTQDFVMVNGPAFGAPDAKHFLKNLKLLASTTDKGESLKKAFSAVARGTEKVVEAFGGKSGTIIAMGGYPETNILGETFYSQVPSLYGPYIAKFSIAPASPALKALTDAPVDLHHKPDGTRDAVNAYFAQNDALWELRVQLCTDIDAMPVEDASVPWPEDKSPFITVAHISVSRQVAWSEARSAAIDARVAFSPWHGLAAHRPIGSIMRVRKVVYDTMSKIRARQNKVSIDEPTALPSV